MRTRQVSTKLTSNTFVFAFYWFVGVCSWPARCRPCSCCWPCGGCGCTPAGSPTGSTPTNPRCGCCMFALMLAGLLMSAAIPNAFDHEGLLFALRVHVHPGRAHDVHGLRRRAGTTRVNHRNFQRITAWLAVSGSVLDRRRHRGAVRTRGGLDRGALARNRRAVRGLLRAGTRPLEHRGLESGRRAHGRALRAVRHDRAGRVHPRDGCDRRVAAGDHARQICAFLVAFLGSVAMWWIYFNIGAERGSREIAGSADPGRYARAVYTYFHIPIIAGIVVCAVADEITIAHPGGHMELPAAHGVVRRAGAVPGRQRVLQARQREVLPALAPGGAGVAGCSSRRSRCCSRRWRWAPRRPSC